MQNLAFDPWTQVTSRNGFAADELISALQKSIRRGDTDGAARFAYEMYITSEALENMLWKRLSVISVEDIGFGDVNAPVIIHTLNTMRCEFDYGGVDRPLFFVHAIRYLCRCQKTRSSDLLKNVIEHEFAEGKFPKIPNVALDMHTRRGREMGRDETFFYEEASRVVPAYTGEEPDYKAQLMKLLKQS